MYLNIFQSICLFGLRSVLNTGERTKAHLYAFDRGRVELVYKWTDRPNIENLSSQILNSKHLFSFGTSHKNILIVATRSKVIWIY